MPLFKQLSDFLSGRTSSRPPSSPQTSPDPAPPSDATSDHIQRTETSGAWNSGSPIEYGSLHTSLESLDPVTTAFSNAEGLRHPYEHRPVRPQYRQTVPRSDSGMRRLSGDTTHAKSRQRSEAYDELRLFPPNKWNDPGGIPIVPGQTKSNKPKSPFRPVDTISKGRDSGPVRAQGKPNRLRNSQPGNVTGYAGSERPNKRRRQDTLDSSRGNFTKPSDNDVEHPAQEAPRIAGHPPRMSPTLSQSSGKQKKQRNNRRSKVDEYRSTENIVRPSRIQPSPKRGPLPNFGAPSDDDRDERFTKNATKERRRNNSFIADVDSGAEQERPDKHEILQSVEIINAKSQDPANKTKMGLRHDPEIAANPRRRVSESRESPDELQGAVTVRPPPAQIGDKRAELGSQRTTGREHQPQDIKPTLFEASGPSKKGKRKNKKTKAFEMSNQRSFKAKLVRTGPIEQQASDGKSVEVHVDMTKRTIALCQETGLENVFEAPLSRVRQILKAESPNNKVRLVLSKTSELDNRIDIEFMSFTVKEEFCCLLGEVDVRDKSSEWMDKAFNKAQRETKQSTNGMKRPSSESGLEQVPDKQRDTTKRVKLTDNLRDENGVAAGRQPSPPDAASRERANPSLTAPKPNKSNPSQPESSPSRVSKSATDPGVEIPVKKSASSITTRAMSRLPSATTVVCDDSDDENTQPPLPAVNTEKWHKPLVYPLVGKKKAEVDVYDLDRLRENEFLNDNLIGFYIRFLQDHLERTNSDAAKRVYFFNSFFHDTLMNVPRGKRGINYDGVQKWTRTVDIFSHDYVVVPINESAHWYVAIICNLPSLQGIVQEGLDPNESTQGEKEPSGPPDSQVQEISETPEPEVATNKDKEEKHATGSGPTRAELARRSLETMRIADGAGKDQPAESPAADQEWPELEASPERPSKTLSSLTENATTPEKLDTKEAAQLPEPSAKPRKQKAKRAGPRYDVCQPIIITFDSLNVPRSPTISSLREYLYEEAKSKKGVEIDKGLIKGMRARDIPLQPNYSDCGLYLLAYLEKFVQDPDVFVRKLLQKEMDSKDDWPPLKSGLLRRRLRKFLDMLYDEQEQLKRHEISDKDTMVNKKPVCYLLGSPVLEGAESESKRSPRKKEPSNGSEDLAQAVNSERQSQSEAETSAGQDKPKEIQRSPVVDTKESRHPEASPEKDVVLVPDSQPEAAPPKTKSKSSKPRRQSPESETQPRTVVHNEEDAPEGHSPDDGVRVVAVETQVRGTPTR
ncbi:hypothetical protein ASPFODRAFT_210962 [Aspergillus luchuensis CBS 106.47]|uniref:Ubiquitin-like protease family profile domain-containing protein n=1 Tax=Aspergillus luchuensis (strain CBS 106.47) TaxID=1137211 RepID=A0A1M3T662_ASPLC|nr:hypothetical protein ASPFODRAFT_210962 [Aspergillus luchuensis CBS 106.47]